MEIVENYIAGEYYSVDFSDEAGFNNLGNYVWLCDFTHNIRKSYSYKVINKEIALANKIEIDDERAFSKNNTHGWPKSKLATPEEIQWLNLCIKQDKYIPFEEALSNYMIKPDPSLEPIYKKLLNIN